ncbi:MAG: flagellar export protein FliJ [Succinivibrio sp.]|nr:flagellar export protein FliJ [Succinivibrio sp.]
MADDRALRLVLDMRKKEEKAALEEYIQSNQAILSFENQLKQLREFRNIYNQELADRTQNGMSMTVFLSYENFLGKLELVEQRQEKTLQKLRERAEVLRQQYLKMQQRRKIIEALLEKHRQDAIAAELKAEQKLTDDIVSSKQARLLMEKK